MSEKLQKVLARAGLGSRREIERWIADGRLSINDKVATVGDRVTGEERIRLDGRLLSMKSVQPQATRVIAYHKDMGSVCSRSDPEYDKTVFDDFPKLKAGRWVLVGRLDVNTTGLLLATTDGELANRLMHPKYEIKREYAVRVYGEVTSTMVDAMLKGVVLDDGVARFDSVLAQGGEGRNLWFTVTLHEGRNREVRRLWESQGVQVNRLVRNSFGPVRMPRRLKKGQCEELTESQLQSLYTAVQLDPPGSNNKTTQRKSHKKYSGKKKTSGRVKKPDPSKTRSTKRFSTKK